MKRLILAAGVAAMATTSPVMAQGRSEGNGNGKGNAQAERGNKPDRGQARGNQDRGNDRQQVRGNGNNRGGPPERVERRADRGNQGGGNDRARGNRGNGNDLVRVRGNNGRGDSENLRVDVGGLDIRLGGRDYRQADRGLFRYAASDCPPGLAKKNNGCLPPGQAKKLWGQRAPQTLLGSLLGGAYATWYPDDDYRYRMGDDYIYRIAANGLIDGLIPRYNRPGYFYPVGSYYPEPYNFYNVPRQYRGYYDDPYYRYGDGAIYRIDPETRLIQSVAALLTGDAIVGQPLPAGYGVYNVPYGYRDRYADNDRDWYRYSDGYIYRVEPETLIVAEVLDAIF